MSFINQLSPGVVVQEVDLTTIVPGVSSSRGAYVGEFNWGPVMEPRLIDNESVLISTFNKPTDSSMDSFVGTSFFSCANFLSYSASMFVVRVVTDTAKNSGLATGFVQSIAVSNVASKVYSNTYLTFAGANTSPANAQMVVTGSNTISIVINSAGSGYASAPTVTASGANNDTLIFTPTWSNTNSLLIKNETQFESTYLYANNANQYGAFVAKYPGEIGDSLMVSVCTNSDQFDSWGYSLIFDNAPGTSDYVANKGSANDEMHIVVVDSKGRFTGTRNTVIEKFAFVSKAIDAIGVDGVSSYYKNVLAKDSQYIYALDPIDYANTSATWGKKSYEVTDFARTANKSITLFGGSDGSAMTAAALINGWDLFKNRDVYDVSLLITGASGDISLTVPRYVIDNIIDGSTASTPIQGRKDSIAFLSPRYADVVNQQGSEATNIVNNYLFGLDKNSSYAVVDSGWKYQYDKYNNIYRWIPLNADIAGLCAQTDILQDPWWSPAGLNRGRIKNVAKLAWNPNQSERDFIYPRGVNPVVSFVGEGPVLFGDKTLQSKPSAFDRINVRRLFIVLEKAISKAAQYSLFEFNDTFTRAQFVSTVEPYLRTIKGRRGIYDFKVVCDETNNTPDIIDRNAFVGDIYIKPARSINFIQLNFVAVRTGVDFNTVIGLSNPQ